MSVRIVIWSWQNWVNFLNMFSRTPRCSWARSWTHEKPVPSLKWKLPLKQWSWRIYHHFQTMTGAYLLSFLLSIFYSLVIFRVPAVASPLFRYANQVTFQKAYKKNITKKQRPQIQTYIPPFPPAIPPENPHFPLRYQIQTILLETPFFILFKSNIIIIRRLNEHWSWVQQLSHRSIVQRHQYI